MHIIKFAIKLENLNDNDSDYDSFDEDESYVDKDELDL
jgi:hypothetical protein